MNFASTAEKVLETLHQMTRTSPPPGLFPEYIDGFFARNRGALVRALVSRLEQFAATRRTSGPTAWGGQRGLTMLTPHQIELGMRVVVLNSLLEWIHGSVIEAPGGGRWVRLDSGATRWFPSLWPEVAPPTHVPRDITVGLVEGEDFGELEPFELWKRIRTLLRRFLRENRQRPDAGESTRPKVVGLWRTFRPWLGERRRPQWLSRSGRELRLLELWSSGAELQDESAVKLELDWLLQLPDCYQERYLPGDKVRFVRFGAHGATDRASEEIQVERLTAAGIVYRRAVYPYHYLEPLATDPGIHTCLPPFEEPTRPMQVFDLLTAGSEWVELAPAQLRAWIDLYLQEHRIEAHVQIVGERGGRIRIEPVDSRYDARYLSVESLNQVFLNLPAVADDGIEIDLFQEEDVFDDGLPFLRRPVQVHPAFVPSLARALTTTAAQHGLSLNPSIRRCLPKPGVVEGEETASGGRRGAAVVYSPLHKMDRGYVGMRVVTLDGFHGRIAWSTQRPGKNHDKIEVFQVRLDSGREVAREKLYLETARPKVIVPDVRVEGRYEEPAEVWIRLSMHYFWLLDQERARCRNQRKESEAWEFLRAWFAAWRKWREANPSVNVQGFEPDAEARIEALIREVAVAWTGVGAARSI